MTPEQKANLDYYYAEVTRLRKEGKPNEALGCYILGRDLAGLPVADQTRKDYLSGLQRLQTGT